MLKRLLFTLTIAASPMFSPSAAAHPDSVEDCMLRRGYTMTTPNKHWPTDVSMWRQAEAQCRYDVTVHQERHQEDAEIQQEAMRNSADRQHKCRTLLIGLVDPDVARVLLDHGFSC